MPEVKHPGFTPFMWRGTMMYKCLRCQYDSGDVGRMRDHVKYKHGGPVEMAYFGSPLEDWVIQERPKGLLAGVKVALGFLTWNQVQESVPCAIALRDEYDRLRAMGAESLVCWVDNGSTDGTGSEVFNVLEGDGRLIHSRMAENRGATVGRNCFIDMARSWGADYLLMVDGDIEVIPYSAYAMAVKLSSLPPTVASLGMEPSNCTPIMDNMVAPDCRLIHDWMLRSTGTTAWTQYGMWRMEPLSHVRFDEMEVLGPGWGLEDDDLYMQLAMLGYTQVYTLYFRYLHRNIHSSVKNLGRQFVMDNWAKRKAYLLEKWRSYLNNPQVALCCRRIAAFTIDGMVDNILGKDLTPATPSVTL